MNILHNNYLSSVRVKLYVTGNRNEAYLELATVMMIFYPYKKK